MSIDSVLVVSAHLSMTGLCVFPFVRAEFVVHSLVAKADFNARVSAVRFCTALTEDTVSTARVSLRVAS